MSYLIDTTIILETVRHHQNKTVIGWLERVPSEALFVSVLTLGEIRKSIEGLADKARQEKLRLWLEHELPGWFEGRVLSVDLAVAECWGRMLAGASRPVPVVDSLLAATALHYGLQLVTHNAGDFDYPGLEVINPWETGL